MSSEVSPSPTVAERLRAVVGAVPLVDLPSAAVVLLMVGAVPALIWATHVGHLPVWLAFLLGTLVMNLSFTAWHEPAHGTFSRSRRLNVAVGWLASFASVYPGYFARRREHLVHHKYEGVRGNDPVYPRIQTTFFGFPLRILQQMVRPDPLETPPTFHPLTAGQRASDLASTLLVLALLGLGGALGIWRAMLVAWVLPRFLVVLIHAYYICFFPHHIDGGGYRLFRIRRDGVLLRLVTVNQHLHGIHHRWPWIPWHKYQAAQRSLGEALDAEGIEFVGKPSLAFGRTESR